MLWVFIGITLSRRFILMSTHNVGLYGFFFCFWLYITVNKFSVILVRFPGFNPYYAIGIKCLPQGHNTAVWVRVKLTKLGSSRVGTSIVQPVNSSGKCRKIPAWQILQKSLKWQILAFMNKSKLKTCEI